MVDTATVAASTMAPYDIPVSRCKSMLFLAMNAFVLAAMAAASAVGFALVGTVGAFLGLPLGWLAANGVFLVASGLAGVFGGGARVRTGHLSVLLPGRILVEPDEGF